MEFNFAAYLKKLGKKPHVARTLAAQVSQFEESLNEKSDFSRSDARPEHPDEYASQCEGTDH